MKRILATTILTATLTVFGASPALADDGSDPWIESPFSDPLGTFAVIGEDDDSPPIRHVSPTVEVTDFATEDPPAGPSEDESSPEETAVSEPEDGARAGTTGSAGAPSSSSAPAQSEGSTSESTAPSEGDTSTADDARTADIEEAADTNDQGTTNNILLVVVGVLAGLFAACATALMRGHRTRKA